MPWKLKLLNLVNNYFVALLSKSKAIAAFQLTSIL